MRAIAGQVLRASSLASTSATAAASATVRRRGASRVTSAGGVRGRRATTTVSGRLPTTNPFRGVASARGRLVCVESAPVRTERETTGGRIAEQDDARLTPSAREATLVAVLAVVTALSDCGAAYAGLYDGYGVPTEEATPLQNLFGFAFTAFSFWYFTRAIAKRSGKAREFRVANRIPEEERAKIDEERAKKTKELTAMQSFTGGLTGIGISIVLYVFASKVSDTFDGKALPESETVRQISITVRTIVEGLAYLATFVYAANGVGLVALAGQKTLDYFNGKDLIEDVAAKRAEEDTVEDKDAQ